ncbi:MAG TPA: C4-type zinc ribbon domain-containing protein [Acidimicrobiales bacterium]|jgi:hypothetical protein|nr:C4-type zinc ribbon domain-containing protein [Acidimicrobiales bacterium]
MGSPEQDALLALQDIDTSIDQHRHRRSALPARSFLADLDGRRTAALAARAEVAARASEVAARQAALETDLASSEARITEITRRLSSGEIKAAREVGALAASVEHLRARISGLEDHILETMEERAPFDDRVAAIDAELADIVAQRDVTAGTLAGDESSIDAELELLATARRAAVAAVGPAQIKEYERLRPRLDGVAVARLVGSRCDGCHLTLPATEIDRFRHLAADVVVHCEQCGRILVRP